MAQQDKKGKDKGKGGEKPAPKRTGESEAEKAARRQREARERSAQLVAENEAIRAQREQEARALIERERVDLAPPVVRHRTEGEALDSLAGAPPRRSGGEVLAGLSVASSVAGALLEMLAAINHKRPLRVGEVAEIARRIHQLVNDGAEVPDFEGLLGELLAVEG